MATLTTTLNVAFTVPAAGLFNVQSTGTSCKLQRRNTAGAAWADVGVVDGAQDCNNTIANTEWRFVPFTGTTPAVQADQ